jgi:hypothetical protein
VGGGLEGVAVVAWARSNGTTATVWGATIDPTVLVELRLVERLLLGVQAGPEFLVPTLHFVGTGGAVQWGPARFNAGLRLGVMFGR